jgi:hypothetical protein
MKKLRHRIRRYQITAGKHNLSYPGQWFYLAGQHCNCSFGVKYALLEAFASAHDLDTAYPHRFKISHAGKPESNDHDKVAKKKDGAFEVVALPLAVHVAKEEDAENDCDHIPLREDQAESTVGELCPLQPLSIDGTK